MRFRCVAMNNANPEPPLVLCPECGARIADYDGIGFVYCEFCEHCTHPAMSGEPLTCDLCHERAAEKL